MEEGKTKNTSDELWDLYNKARKNSSIENLRLAFEILHQIQTNEREGREKEIRSIVQQEIKKTFGD